jgi:hypothetical protein
VKIGETKVIDQRETSNMHDEWWEYLVLEKLKKGQFRLDIRRNEVFDEVFDYCQENDLIGDDGKLNVPDQIEGQKVYVSGSVIYGENLVQDWVDDPEVIFTSPEQDTVADWCKWSRWDYDRIIKSLVEECSGSKQSSKKKPAKKKSATKSKKSPKKDRSLSPEEVKMRAELLKMRQANWEVSKKRFLKNKKDSSEDKKK